MHEPDHEEDEEIEDAEVDEQMDTGVRIKSQRPDEDESSEEITHDEEPDVTEEEVE